jgi:hypothetical protein
VIYRPQFAFPTPDGCRDQEAELFYDTQSNPGLAVAPGDPAKIYNIPLTIDPDAEFLWRGVKFDHVKNANIGVRFRDPYGRYMSDDFVPIWLCHISPSNTLTMGGQACIHEPEIVCPAASVVMVDFCSYDTTPWTSGGPSPVMLCGVKRYKLDAGCDCG